MKFFIISRESFIFFIQKNYIYLELCLSVFPDKFDSIHILSITYQVKKIVVYSG
jgi:hypothetical protein